MRRISSKQTIFWMVLLLLQNTVSPTVTSGALWGVNSTNNVWFRTGVTDATPWGGPLPASNNYWQQVTGSIQFIAITYIGTIWGIDTNNNIVFLDGVSKATPTGTGWSEPITPPAGKTPGKIYGGINGAVYLLATDGTIWSRNGITTTNPAGNAGWNQLPANLGYGIYNNWTSTPKFTFPTSGVSLGFSATGQMWATDMNGTIYQYASPSAASGSTIPGGLSQVSSGYNGNTWGVNRNGQIYYMLPGQNWVNVYGQLNQVNVGPTGQVTGVNINGQIYIRTSDGAGTQPMNDTYAGGQGWLNIPGGLTQVLTGPSLDSLPAIAFEAAGSGAADGAVAAASATTLPVASTDNPEYNTMFNTAASQSFQTMAIPNGWTEEGDGANVVAVGSENNNLIAYGIQIQTDAEGQENGVLLQYQSGSMDVNPWKPVLAVNDASGNPIDVSDVSVASDGTVCIVSAIGQVITGGTTSNVGGVQTTTGGTVSATGGVIYQYNANNKNWVALPTKNNQNNKVTMFDGVSVGNKNNIWATEANSNNVYQLVKDVKDVNKDLWTLRSNACTTLSVGLDNTVLAINTVNNVFSYDAIKNIWNQIYYTAPAATATPGTTGATAVTTAPQKLPLQLTQVSVGNKDNAWGINNNGGAHDLWFYNKATNNWAQAQTASNTPARGFVSISCNAAGIAMATESNGTIMMNAQGNVNAQGQPTTRAVGKQVGTIPTTTPATKQAAAVAKTNQKVNETKARATHVKKGKKAVVKTVDSTGKPTTTTVNIDSKGKVIATTPKTVGKTVRTKKAKVQVGVVASKATAEAIKTAAKPGQKPVMVRK